MRYLHCTQKKCIQNNPRIVTRAHFRAIAINYIILRHAATVWLLTTSVSRVEHLRRTCLRAWCRPPPPQTGRYHPGHYKLRVRYIQVVHTASQQDLHVYWHSANALKANHLYRVDGIWALYRVIHPRRMRNHRSDIITHHATYIAPHYCAV